jgi:hypothetical protein
VGWVRDEVGDLLAEGFLGERVGHLVVVIWQRGVVQGE